MTDRYQIRFMQIPRWAAVLAGIGAIAFAIALLLLSVTVFLVLLPVIAVAGGLYYLFGGRRGAADVRRRESVEIIEAEYRVIEPDQIERNRDQRRS
jgi:hypothetical protein